MINYVTKRTRSHENNVQSLHNTIESWSIGILVISIIKKGDGGTEAIKETSLS